MSFGIALNKRSKVQVCTPELLAAAIDSPHTARACAAIADALEACRRGELTRAGRCADEGELRAVERAERALGHGELASGAAALLVVEKVHLVHACGWHVALQKACFEAAGPCI